MTLKQITTGQPLTGIPANTWARHNKATRTVEQANTDRRDFQGAARFPMIPVKVKPDVDVVRYNVVSLGDVVRDPNDDPNQLGAPPVFDATAPVADDASPVIMLQSMPADGYAWAAMVGVTWAKIDLQNTDDMAADVIADDLEKLESDDAGAIEILWRPGGTGIKMCVIRLGIGGNVCAALKSYPIETLSDNGIDRFLALKDDGGGALKCVTVLAVDC